MITECLKVGRKLISASSVIRRWTIDCITYINASLNKFQTNIHRKKYLCTHLINDSSILVDFVLTIIEKHNRQLKEPLAIINALYGPKMLKINEMIIKVRSQVESSSSFKLPAYFMRCLDAVENRLILVKEAIKELTDILSDNGAYGAAIKELKAVVKRLQTTNSIIARKGKNFDKMCIDCINAEKVYFDGHEYSMACSKAVTLAKNYEKIVYDGGVECLHGLDYDEDVQLMINYLYYLISN